jgi:hypothetical protein
MQRLVANKLVKWGDMPEGRDATGWKDEPTTCFVIEVGEDAVTPFSYIREDDVVTPNVRYSPLTPYGNFTHHPWTAYAGDDSTTASREDSQDSWKSQVDPRVTEPWSYISDRQVARILCT